MSHRQPTRRGALSVVAGIALLLSCAGLALHRGEGAAATSAPPLGVQPVVAELDIELAPESTLSARARRAQRARVQRLGHAALDAADLNDRALGSARILSTLPYLTVSVDRAGAHRLGTSPGVKRVVRARTYAVPPRQQAPRRAAPVARAAQRDPVRSGDFSNDTGANVAWAWNIYGQGSGFAVINTGLPSWGRSDHLRLEACYSSSYQLAPKIRVASSCSTTDDGAAFGRGTAVTNWSPFGARGYRQLGLAGISPFEWYGYPISHRGVAPYADEAVINVGGIRLDETSPSATSVEVAYSEADLLAALDQVNRWADEWNLAAVLIGFNLPSAYSRAPCEDRDLLRHAISALNRNDVSVVVGAGDEGTDPDHGMKLAKPACVPEVITVGATDRAGAVAAPYSQTNRKVDVFAPGNPLVPALNSEETPWIRTRDPGTDYAAALVTGAIALYKQKYPAARPASVKRALRTFGPWVDMGNGIRRHRLAIDRLLRLNDYRPRSGVDERCLELEFRPNHSDDYPANHFGFVRLRCQPHPMTDRILVTVDGPELRSEEFALIPKDRDVGHYGDDQIFLGANTGREQGIHAVGEYRTCYFLYLTTDDISSASSKCREDEIRQPRPGQTGSDWPDPPVPVLYPERHN